MANPPLPPQTNKLFIYVYLIFPIIINMVNIVGCIPVFAFKENICQYVGTNIVHNFTV